MSKISKVRMGSGKERRPPKGKPAKSATDTKSRSRKQKTEGHGKSSMNTSADIRKQGGLMGRRVR